MNDGWKIARQNFTDDDGSLPGVEFRNLLPSSVRSLVNYFRQNGELTSVDAHLWHNQLQADVMVSEVDDPAGLVVSGIAAPFTCCFQLPPEGDNRIPELGLFVFQNDVEIFYRMGADWNHGNVDAFFRLLAYLKSLAPEAIVESADGEGVPYPDEFKQALGQYTDLDKAS